MQDNEEGRMEETRHKVQGTIYKKHAPIMEKFLSLEP